MSKVGRSSFGWVQVLWIVHQFSMNVHSSFLCNDWLASDEGDGSLVRRLRCASVGVGLSELDRVLSGYINFIKVLRNKLKPVKSVGILDTFWNEIFWKPAISTLTGNWIQLRQRRDRISSRHFKKIPSLERPRQYTQHELPQIDSELIRTTSSNSVDSSSDSASTQSVNSRYYKFK